MSKRDGISRFSWTGSAELPVIEGRILGIDEEEGKYGTYPVVYLDTHSIGGMETDHCEVKVRAFHSQLKRSLESLSLEIGDDVRIEYHGMVPGANGSHDYHGYTVEWVV